MLICIIGRAELIIAITQVLAQKSGVNEYFVTEYSFSFIYMEKCTTQCTSVNQLHVVCHASNHATHRALHQWKLCSAK